MGVCPPPMSTGRADICIISLAKDLGWGSMGPGAGQLQESLVFTCLPPLLSAEAQSVIFHLEETPGVCKEGSPAGV